jgi:Sulfotransferase family
MGEDAISDRADDARASVVVFGLPRSGTTWTATALAAATGASVVHEPDNEKEQLAALVAKKDLGRFPVLAPGAHSPAYQALWRSALSGASGRSVGRRSRAAQRVWAAIPQQRRERALLGHPGPAARAAMLLQLLAPPAMAPTPRPQLVVKSVHAPLALDFLLSTFSLPRVVVVVRHPANVMSSLIELDLPDRDRELDRDERVISRYVQPWGVPQPGRGREARAAWQVCLLTSALLEVAEQHPRVVLAVHEDLCRSPMSEFRRICDRLNVEWTDGGDDFLRKSNRPGAGFELRRVTVEEPDRWVTRLGETAVDILRSVMASFPHLNRWSEDFTYVGRA